MYVVLRSNIAGVFFGKLLKATRPGYYRLTECRKVWSWENPNHVEGLALQGPALKGAQITDATRQDVRAGEGDQILRATQTAVEQFAKVPPWA